MDDDDLYYYEDTPKESILDILKNSLSNLGLILLFLAAFLSISIIFNAFLSLPQGGL